MYLDCPKEQVEVGLLACEVGPVDGGGDLVGRGRGKRRPLHPHHRRPGPPRFRPNRDLVESVLGQERSSRTTWPRTFVANPTVTPSPVRSIARGLMTPAFMTKASMICRCHHPARTGGIGDVDQDDVEDGRLVAASRSAFAAVALFFIPTRQVDAGEIRAQSELPGHLLADPDVGARDQHALSWVVLIDSLLPSVGPARVSWMVWSGVRLNWHARSTLQRCFGMSKPVRSLYFSDVLN